MTLIRAGILKSVVVDTISLPVPGYYCLKGTVVYGKLHDANVEASQVEVIKNDIDDFDVELSAEKNTISLFNIPIGYCKSGDVVVINSCANSKIAYELELVE